MAPSLLRDAIAVIGVLEFWSFGRGGLDCTVLYFPGLDCTVRRYGDGK